MTRENEVNRRTWIKSVVAGVSCVACIQSERHWANAEVTENRPLEPNRPNCMIGDRSLVTFGNTDNGKCGWITYGPVSLEIGTPVELFEFKICGKWKMDFRVRKASP